MSFFPMIKKKFFLPLPVLLMMSFAWTADPDAIPAAVAESPPPFAPSRLPEEWANRVLFLGADAAYDPDPDRHQEMSKKIVAAIEAVNPRFKACLPENRRSCGRPNTIIHYRLGAGAKGYTPHFIFEEEDNVIETLAPIRDLPVWGIAFQFFHGPREFTLPKDFPVERLYLAGISKIPALDRCTDLKELHLDISDPSCSLTPLQGLSLERLVLTFNQSKKSTEPPVPVSLEPLRGMPLKELYFVSVKTPHNDPVKVASLAPLAELPLTTLMFDFKQFPDAPDVKIVRTNPSLKFLANNWYSPLLSTAEFWKEFDARHQ